MSPPQHAQAYKDGYTEGVKNFNPSESGEGDQKSRGMVFNNKGDVIINGNPEEDVVRR